MVFERAFIELTWNERSPTMTTSRTKSAAVSERGFYLSMICWGVIFLAFGILFLWWIRKSPNSDAMLLRAIIAGSFGKTLWEFLFDNISMWKP